MAERKLSLRERLTGKIETTTTPEITEATSQEAGVDFLVASTAFSKRSILEQDFLGVSSLDDKQLYELYDTMDEDSIISAALDLLADSATPVNTKDGHVVSIESSDAEFKREINEFLHEVVNIDVEAWEYVRTVAKYGKIFLDTKATDNGAEWSFIEYPHAYNIKALTLGQDYIKYYAVLQDDKEESILGENPFTNKYTQQLNQKQNKEYSYTVEGPDRFISAFNSHKLSGKMVVKSEGVISDKEDAEELYIKTGKSLLAPVVDTWRTLSILENQLTAYRLSKSNVFKLVQIDVTGANTKEANRIVESVKNSIKSSENLDLSKQTYKNRQSQIPHNDFIYIPKKGDLGSVTIAQVGGEVGTIDLTDINYFRNKLFAGLGTLKAYLGWEESTPGGIGDSTLTKLDERAAKRAKRFQLILKHIVKQLVEYYWSYSKTTRALTNIPAYNIILAEVSSQEKDEERTRLTNNLSIANDIVALAANERFADKVSDDKLFTYIFSNILNIDPRFIDTSITPEEVRVSKIRDLTESTNGLKAVKYKRKIKLGANIHTHEETSLEELLEKYELYIETADNKVLNLTEAVNQTKFHKLLNEKTIKQLKDLVKSDDPKRLQKSKKLTGKYLGISKENFIQFQVTAEDVEKNKKEGKPTSYLTQISLKDLAKHLSQEGIEDIKDADLVREALKGNIAVSCECPASKYWGQQYVGTQEGYSIEINNIAPTKNIPTQVICKHTTLSVTLVPIFWNTIVRDLRAKGVLGGDKVKPKADKKKEKEDTELVDLKQSEEVE